MAKKFVFPTVPNKFKPVNGQKYYTINRNQLVCPRIWRSEQIDKQRLRHNNVFQTAKEGKAVRDKFVAALTAAQR